MQFDTDCTPGRAQGILVTHTRLSGRTYAVDCVWTYYKYIRPCVRRGPYRDDRVRRYGRLATRVHCPLLSLPISPSRVVCLFIYTSISQFPCISHYVPGRGNNDASLQYVAVMRRRTQRTLRCLRGEGRTGTRKKKNNIGEEGGMVRK